MALRLYNFASPFNVFLDEWESFGNITNRGPNKKRKSPTWDVLVPEVWPTEEYKMTKVEKKDNNTIVSIDIRDFKEDEIEGYS